MSEAKHPRPRDTNSLRQAQGGLSPATQDDSAPRAPNLLPWVAWAAAAAIYLVIVIGATVRVTGSGLGCPDWPLCYGGALPPPHAPAIIEFSHRLVGLVASGLILAALVLWVRSRRADRRVVAGSIGILLLLAAQVALGPIIVAFELPPTVVMVHLGLAMLLLGILVALAVGEATGNRQQGVGSRQQGVGLRPHPNDWRFPEGEGAPLRLALSAVVAVYLLVLTGANMRASGASWACVGFPACNGELLPLGAGRLVDIHLLHRLMAYAVVAHLVVTLLRLWRAYAGAPGVRQGAAVTGACLVGQFGIGAGMVGVGPSPVLQVLHVAGAGALWASVVALYVLARSARAQFVTNPPPLPSPARGEGVHPPPLPSPARGEGVHPPSQASPARGAGVRLAAYVGLTKPRIVGLLLITTFASMVLAANGLPPLHLVAFTLVGGALGAGGANALNCWLDRDIDAVMERTSRRAIPGGAVSPREALGFGVILGVASFVVLALSVNLLAAFLTLAALVFYVGVYTAWLKRSTVQNIVIGGAAGAVPPLVGWAAVTGEVGVPAVYLFAIIFFWTPPHFWALSLLLKGDYERAGVPMLPVVRGEEETRRQILLYAGLLIALTLLAYAFGLFGLLYVAAAALLGGVFVASAARLFLARTEEAARTLFRYSLLYLPLLFAAMVLDRQLAS